jgi:hypothetical protein
VIAMRSSSRAVKAERRQFSVGTPRVLMDANLKQAVSPLADQPSTI